MRVADAVARIAGAVALLVAVGCSGDGSDIGPNLPLLPERTFEVLIRDDADRGVCNARVSLRGVSESAARSGRDGRADLPASAGIAPTVIVDATLAESAPGRMLGSLRFAGATTDDGQELGFVVHLPDLADSVGLSLVAGSTPGGELDDSASSGAILDVPAGSQVDAGGAAEVVLRTGQLGVAQIPPLRRPDATAVLPTRGIVVDPPAVRLTPGARLSVPNDVGLPPAAMVPLFATDPETGDWVVVGSGTVRSDGSRIDSGPDAVRAGGIYTFVAEPVATTVVRGRILDPVVADRPLHTSLVRAGQAVGRTRPDGRFELAGVPASDASGAPLMVALAVHGGRFQFPVGAFFEAESVPGGATDLGDLRVAIGFASQVRILTVLRGRAQPWVSIGLNSVTRPSLVRGVTDARGRLDLGDVHAGLVGYLETVRSPRNVRLVLSAESVTVLDEFRRSLDLRVFFDEQPWIVGGRGAQIRTVDAAGGGRLEGVRVFRSNRGGPDDFVARSVFSTFVGTSAGLDSEITSALDTSSDGRRVRSAFSTRRIDVRWIEQPLHRALRKPVGEFEPFDLVRGSVAGAGGDVTVASRSLQTAVGWLDAALADDEAAADLPVRLDPAVTGGAAFEVGVARSAGQVVALRGVRGPEGGIVDLAELSLATLIRTDPERVQELVLDGPLAADTTYRLTTAVAGLDPRATAADLSADVASGFADGRALEIARGLVGNLGVDGSDLLLRLPALVGPLDRARWMTVLRADFAAGGATYVQRGIHVVDGRQPSPPRPLLAVPELLDPVPDAAVPVTGFELLFTPSAGALYTVVTLESIDDPADRSIWTALVAGDEGGVRFRPLPEGPQVLRAGRHRLTVTCGRIDSGPLHLQERGAYQVLISRYAGITALERETEALASVTIEIDVVP